MDLNEKGVVVSRTNLIENKKEIPIPWKGIIFCIVFVGLVWGGVYSYNIYVEKQIETLKSSLAGARKDRDYKKIAGVADTANRLVSIEKILDERTDWEKLFKKLEEKTIPEVTFSNMDAVINEETPANSASLSKEEGLTELNYRVDIIGTTLGVLNISKQIAAFKENKGEEEPLATDVRVEKIDLKRTESENPSTGIVEFSLQMDINPNIFLDLTTQ